MPTFSSLYVQKFKNIKSCFYFNFREYILKVMDNI